MSAKWLSLTTTNRDFTLRQVKMAEALIMKRKQMVEAFKKNVTGAIVCDKCLQPIDAMHSSQSLVQLEGELTSAVKEHNQFVKVARY
jgi:hypothetical protein